MERSLFIDVVPPPSGQRLLPELPKSPYGDKKGIEDLKYITKRLIEIRGPELYRNHLIHEQYGIASNSDDEDPALNPEKTKEVFGASLESISSFFGLGYPPFSNQLCFFWKKCLEKWKMLGIGREKRSHDHWRSISNQLCDVDQ
uniref:Uncharacterized protein n=1 Tax=Romanomermis culicivorax TaxID=13658 RepID=A0A915HVF0_ROMCU